MKLIFHCGDHLQAGLVKEEPTKEFLDEYAGLVLQKNVESLYACGGRTVTLLLLTCKYVRGFFFDWA